MARMVNWCQSCGQGGVEYCEPCVGKLTATIADLRRQLAEESHRAAVEHVRANKAEAERNAAQETLRELSKVKSMQTGCCETCGEIPECFGGKCNCDLVVGHRRRGG